MEKKKKDALKDGNPNVTVTNSGKILVNEPQYFKSAKIKSTLQKLIDSSIYKEFKREIKDAV